MYIIVHGALYQNCAGLKSLQYKVCTKVGMWCMVYGADLESMIQSVYPSWCMVHSGALHHNCGGFKLYHTRCVPKLMHGALHQNCAGLKSTMQSLYQSWCMVHCTTTVVI